MSVKTNKLFNIGTKEIRAPQNPFLLFIPFLLLYALLVLIAGRQEPWGDETRYLRDIDHLLHGYFSPPAPDIILASGPGYQLVLLPFVALKMPLIIMKLLNAVFLYLSVVLLFKILTRFASFKIAFWFTFFWGCYYNSFDFVPLLYSETISIFLVTLLLFLIFNVFGPGNEAASKKNIYGAGFVFGYLILTKVIFAYVLICMMLGIAVLWVLNKKVTSYKKGAVILLIAFATILPYLIYTYQLTGRVFYLSTQSGNNLYWMSSPNDGEYGSWFVTPMHHKDSASFRPTAQAAVKKTSSLDFKTRGYFLPGFEDTIIARNRKDLEEISLYDNMGLELDDAYKRIAMKNIKEHPSKFLMNCFSNVGRMLFNYPYSYTLQKPGTLLRLPLNGILVILSLFCIIPTFSNWKRLPFAIRFMLFVACIYLGGSIFGCAEIRMFTLIVPVLLVWIAFTISKSVRINFKEWEQ